MKTQTKKILNYNFIPLIIISLPFVLTALSEKGKSATTLFVDLIINKFPTTISSSETFTSLFVTGINIFIVTVSPFVITTLLEIFRKGGVRSFWESSLGRIRYSEGYKGADIWYYVLSVLQSKFPFILTLSTLGHSLFVSEAEKGLTFWFSNLYEFLLPYKSIFPSLIIMISGILLSELVFYIRHWILHTKPMFWDLHEFHHSATEMTIFSNYRNAPLESFILDFLQLPFAIFFALMINKTLSEGSYLLLCVYTIHATLGLIFRHYGHSSYKIIYPKPISYFLQSPALHWLHHSNNPKHFNCNIGNTYTIWDKLFGTYLDESHLNEINGFGVENSEYNKHHPIYSYSILPAIRILKRFRFT